MSRDSRVVEDDIEQNPKAHANQGLLRLFICGNVADGKSTLIGRLVDEPTITGEEQPAAPMADSRKTGTGGGTDYALLLDRLARPGQGIAIAVVHRFCSGERGKFVAVDISRLAQHAQSVMMAAPTAEVAILLADARHGLLDQTRRHGHLVRLLGIRHIVLAVNRMDMVDYSPEVFAGMEAAYGGFARRIGLKDIVAIPISVTRGDNIAAPLGNTPWYRGPSLVEYLEAIPAGNDLAEEPFRMPVQSVHGPGVELRGIAGKLASGTVKPGDRIRVLPSGRESRVARIVTAAVELPVAVVGHTVTLTLDDEAGVSCGDVISAANDPVEVADQFEATLVWTGDAPMLPGRDYLMKIGTMAVNATVAPLKYVVNANTLEHMAATRLERNEIGVCQLELDRAVAFEPYEKNRDLGGFLLEDRMTGSTVGAGMLRFALRRSQNVHWQAIDLNKAARAAIKGQRPSVLWFTGLPASGKSTIANLVERRLHAMGRHTYLLDGDNVRHGLCKDLGFTEAARVENIRRVAEVAALMADAGLIVLTAFISPFRSERRMARALLPAGQFLEIFVDAPLAVAEARDPKGLYRKARRGELRNFTGIDSPYEAPERADIRIDSATLSPEDAAEHVVEEMLRRGL